MDVKAQTCSGTHSVTSTPPGPTALSESHTQNTWLNGRCLLLSPKFPRGVGTGLWWTERREWPLLVTARYCPGGGSSPRLTGTSNYQVLLLNVPFRSEGELISDPNASGTFKEECFLRNLHGQARGGRA